MIAAMVTAYPVVLTHRRPKPPCRSVVCVGLGAMGEGIARLLRERGAYRIVAAVDPNPHPGVEDVLVHDGVKLVSSISEVPAQRADVCVICTESGIDRVLPTIHWALERRMNVITTAEEGLPYPWTAYRGEAEALDELARRNRVTVLSTGINPGFAMDVLPILLTAACRRVRRIDVHRANDLSSFGASVMRSFGIGLPPDEFDDAVRAGTVVGHTGFVESISMIAAATGLEVDEIRRELSPIIATNARVAPHATAPPGTVAGCNDVAEGLRAGEVVIRLEHPQQIDPAAEDVRTVDRICVDGDPSLTVVIEPEIPGGAGTIAVIANMIPALIDAPAGLATMDRLRLPAGVFA